MPNSRAIFVRGYAMGTEANEANKDLFADVTKGFDPQPKVAVVGTETPSFASLASVEPRRYGLS